MRVRPWPSRQPGSRGASPGSTLLVLTLLSLLLGAGCSEAGGPPSEDPVFDTPAASLAEEGSGATAKPTPPPPPTPESTPARAVELHKAVAAGEVSVAGYGDGLERLDVKVTSKTREPLRVVVNPGTVFDARASATQAMVVTTKQVIELDPGATEEVSLDVACSEMHKDQPGSDDTFKLVKRSLPKDLVKLLATDGLSDAGFRTRQFAIWTILEDPARSGFVRLGTLGTGSGPTAAEIAMIRDLFDEAGIDPRDYRATR